MKSKDPNDVCSSDPCDYCVHKGKRQSCNPCYEHAGFQGLRLKKMQSVSKQDAPKNG